jgi:hypothetical protein
MYILHIIMALLLFYKCELSGWVSEFGYPWFSSVTWYQIKTYVNYFSLSKLVEIIEWDTIDLILEKIPTQNAGSRIESIFFSLPNF